MELRPIGPTAKGPAETFTGDVYVTMINSPEPPSRMVVSLVRFTPGARSAWHSHAVGQTLHVTEGVGLVGTRGGKVIRMHADDTVYTPPGEEYWHGACAETFMSHLGHARRHRRRRPHQLARARHRRGLPGRRRTVAAGGSDMDVVTSARLAVRPPREADRDRFVELFCDEDFMVFYPGVPTAEQAEDRFDHMVDVCRTIPFCKQPVVELSSGLIVGYTGVDHIDFEGSTWLEWGYRLVPAYRGRGYATEASQALLAKAHQTYSGELLAIIAPDNLASQNVGHKLGFTFWKQAPVDGDIRNLYTLSVGAPAP